MKRRNSILRAFGTLLLVLSAVVAATSVTLLFEPDASDDAVPQFVLSGLLAFLGAFTLSRVERPIYGAGRSRQIVSTLLLVASVLSALTFLTFTFEDGVRFSESVEPLFLTLVFGGSGLALRGTRSFGSLRDNLTLLGIAAVVVPLFVLLFAFSTTTEDTEVDLGVATGEVTVDTTALPLEVLIATIILISVGIAAVWFWSRRAVAPMAEITKVANEIQAGSLDRRIGLQTGAREVRALADSFDKMLDRLAKSSGAQQRMLEDASHELRTPLTALALNNEVVLDAPHPTIDDYRAAAERSQALIDRLQGTIDELLLQGRTTNLELRQIDNDLMAIVARVADQHRVLNPAVPVAIRGPHALRLGIDGPSIQRALVNLVENATRYSPPGVPIEIDVIENDSATLLSVTDHGPGIPEGDRDAIFDRYYQADDADAGSAGIGLALVKQVAEAHGRIEVVSPVDGHGCGTRFTIILMASALQE